jgi:hypothetical protein
MNGTKVTTATKRGLLLGAASLGIVCGLSTPASAAPAWVDRTLTLPYHDWAFDFGLGIAHAGGAPRDVTGPGVNLEMAVAPADRIELGVRTGLRLGDDGRLSQADYYGRLFDRQTFGTGTDVLANPELRVTGAVVRGDVVELGLEGRLYLPIEQGTNAGVMLGMPLHFHLGRVVRLDTGVYVPIIFSPRTQTYFSAPIDVWIQASPRVWVGPMTGFVLRNVDNHTTIPFGFGFGYQFTHALDLKAMALFPAVNDTNGVRDFGIGAGVQIRIE